MTSQRMEADTQTRPAQGTQYRSAQQAVRETPRTGSAAWIPPAREKKPNGDPCSLTLWGAEED